MNKPADVSVLVVENNAYACELVCDSLNALDYCAQGVNTAEEALKLLHRERFQILLTEVDLPDMSAIPLARVAITFNPEIRIVFASSRGYMLAEREEFDFDFVLKPYRMRELLQILEKHATFDNDDRKSA